jgi:hypothetical protein
MAVLLRVGIAFYLGNVVDAPPLLTDQRSYHALGARLVAGYGFSFERQWYPFTLADTPTAHWSFLQSLFVAAVYRFFGVQPLAARLAEAVLGGILLPLALYALARRALSETIPWLRVGRVEIEQPVPLLAALLGAAYFYFVLYAATLMTETFYIVALLWSLERAIAVAQGLRAGQGPLAREVVWLGVAMGLATLFRQSILPWLVVMFAWLLWLGYRQGALRRATGAVFGSSLILALFILPFTIRNFQVYGDFLLLNSNTGFAMYSAQHPMHGTSFREFEAAPLPPELVRQSLNEAQWDRELLSRGIGFVLADPGRYLLLSLSRVRDYFEFWPTADSTLLHNVGRVGSFGLMLPFMVYGLWVDIRSQVRASGATAPRRSLLSRMGAVLASDSGLLYLFIAFYSLLHILTWAFPRYRLPVDAVLIVFAALGMVELWRRLQARVWHVDSSVSAERAG